MRWGDGHRCWARFAVAAAGLAAALHALQPAQAQDPAPATVLEDAKSGHTHLFASYYQSGVARLGRGDAAGALAMFETASESAPDLPQLQYAFALTLVLADFDDRARALPPIRRAVAAAPHHPLYLIVDTLADAAKSELHGDGALYLSPAGIAELQAAVPLLPAQHDAYNGKYFAALVATLQATDDPSWPQRLPGFAAMLGQGSGVQLPQLGEKLSLGRLLVIAIPEAELRRYETAFVQRLMQPGAAPAR
jgi:hypothetical protein